MALCAGDDDEDDEEEVDDAMRQDKKRQDKTAAAEVADGSELRHDVVFFSGGAASVATLRSAVRHREEQQRGGGAAAAAAAAAPGSEARRGLALLTCFDAVSRQLTQQQEDCDESGTVCDHHGGGGAVHIRTVAQQAQELGISHSLVGVPLHKGLTAADRVVKALKLLLGRERQRQRSGQKARGAGGGQQQLHLWFPDCSDAGRMQRESELLDGPPLLRQQLAMEEEAVSGGCVVVVHFPLLEMGEAQKNAELAEAKAAPSVISGYSSTQ